MRHDRESSKNQSSTPIHKFFFPIRLTTGEGGALGAIAPQVLRLCPRLVFSAHRCAVENDRGRCALLATPFPTRSCLGRPRPRSAWTLTTFSIATTALPQGISSTWKHLCLQVGTAASTMHLLAARCEGSRASSSARRGCVAQLRVLWTRRALQRHSWHELCGSLARTLLLAAYENHS
jgi:hypothetical protein